MTNSINQRIQTELQLIEETKHVTILYACESGSRAWGFPSADSDYDVRFIYVHPRDWYLSVNLEHKRDVIERPIDDELDISGWDLRKALKLFRKSNPPLLEWLGSPIIYSEKGTTAQQMRTLAATYYSPTASSYHYWHMAKGNFREYLQGDPIWVKKYFYVLRPLLAIIWIERGLGVVPTEFDKLLDQTVDDQTVRHAIDQLIAEKKTGAELKYGPRIPLISDFIQLEVERLQNATFQYNIEKCPIDLLDTLFQNALESESASHPGRVSGT